MEAGPLMKLLPALRNLTAITAGAGTGIAVGAALNHWGPETVGVGVAIAAAAVLAWGLIAAIQEDRARRWRR